MAMTVNVGYPRIGAHRELKKALEAYWNGKLTELELHEEGRKIRLRHWKIQQDAGIQQIPSNDFSWYDHVLDTTAMVGAIPARYGWADKFVALPTYFAMARGRQTAGCDAPAMEMTKWFDTNYHYIVPEFSENQHFRLASLKPIEEFLEADAIGIHTRPTLLGPITYLLSGKCENADTDPMTLLDELLPVYEQILQRLAEAGADWVQLEEPALVLDLSAARLSAFETAYRRLHDAAPKLQMCLATYFGSIAHHLQTIMNLPVQAWHVDLARAPEQLAQTLAALPEGMMLSLGLIDGRNIWRANLRQAEALARQAVQAIGSDRLMIAPSCSLMFCPEDLALETALDSEIRSWLAFARQKLDELTVLTRSLNEGVSSVQTAYDENDAIFTQRRNSERIHHPEVKQRLERVTDAMRRRTAAFPQRKAIQQQRFGLPLLPTTTIGSFPQTAQIRQARLDWTHGRLTPEQYDERIKREIEVTVRFQEDIDVDVLVHGEAERTDMVEYFGMQLDGFAFTQHGWVQSYGSRCVRPPIIYGDISRPNPMTVRWAAYAQSLTNRPMKGMLTGPVTILEWSFVRDDQPRSATCDQIALAIRDEVCDLEAAGIGIIQVDEPALREGLPLRREQWGEYLRWAVEAFRLATSGIRESTQLHTHMCYAEFHDIIEAIGDMDADVISIESSRSKMELLNAFTDYRYVNDIGPGMYDIHSPRIPSQHEYETLLRKALQKFQPEQLWVNPDCGLKTRQWEEVKPALQHMIAAAKAVRAAIATQENL